VFANQCIPENQECGALHDIPRFLQFDLFQGTN
jgi:hypothetical protein